jgi:hypothetical protein
LIRRKIEEERVAVIKARMNEAIESCSNDFGSLEIKCIADANEITNEKKTAF